MAKNCPTCGKEMYAGIVCDYCSKDPNPHRTKCKGCGQEIHVTHFGGIRGTDTYCNNATCLIQLADAMKQDEQNQGVLKPENAPIDDAPPDVTTERLPHVKPGEGETPKFTPADISGDALLFKAVPCMNGEKCPDLEPKMTAPSEKPPEIPEEVKTLTELLGGRDPKTMTIAEARQIILGQKNACKDPKVNEDVRTCGVSGCAAHKCADLDKEKAACNRVARFDLVEFGVTCDSTVAEVEQAILRQKEANERATVAPQPRPGFDFCARCGQAWEKHDFGVPTPGCPDDPVVLGAACGKTVDGVYPHKPLEYKELTPVAEPTLEEAHLTPGKIALTLKHSAFGILANNLVKVFREAGAVNFLETQMKADDGLYLITMQRLEGKTPAQLLDDEKKKVAVLENEIQTLLGHANARNVDDVNEITRLENKIQALLGHVNARNVDDFNEINNLRKRIAGLLSQLATAEKEVDYSPLRRKK